MKTYFEMKKFLIIATVILGGSSLFAANRYVRAGATGSNNGTDWANAYTALPATLTRGDTYYVADGTYPGYTFDDANSGTTLITIKKATIADHGTDTGWNNAYGDGQAEFTGSFLFTRDYYLIDGQVRNENTWMDGYGFRLNQVRSYTETHGGGGDHITVRYADIGRTLSTSSPGNLHNSVYLHGPGWKYNITISRSFLHNDSFIQAAVVDGITVEYTMFAWGWAKESFRGQYGCKNGILRFNKFYQSSLELGGDNPTAPIAIWDESTPGSFDNWQIYGNVIWYDRVPNISNAAIAIGGGPGWAGVPANNVKIYNNTIAGFGSEPARIVINGDSSSGTGKEVMNNLWYGCSVVSWPTSNVNASNNGSVSSNPFVNYSAFDFRLSAPLAGSAISSPYNTDIVGNPRGADGVFDRGAFEFVGNADTTAPTVSLSAPGNGATVLGTVTLAATASDNVGVTGVKFFVNGQQVADDTSSPYSFGWNSILLGNGSYQIYAQARDAAGNTRNSSTITITVNNLLPLMPPQNLRITQN